MATCAGALAPPMSFELILIVAVVVGLVGAMSGMGGGVVLIPALTFFGMDIKRAIAVSIVSVIATSSGSASAYVRDHITNLKVGMFLEMFTMLGALAGASITVAAGRLSGAPGRTHLDRQAVAALLVEQVGKLDVRERVACELAVEWRGDEPAIPVGELEWPSVRAVDDDAVADPVGVGAVVLHERCARAWPAGRGRRLRDTRGSPR